MMNYFLIANGLTPPDDIMAPDCSCIAFNLVPTILISIIVVLAIAIIIDSIKQIKQKFQNNKNNDEEDDE